MYDRREIPKSVVLELGGQARLGHGGNFEFERSWKDKKTNQSERYQQGCARYSDFGSPNLAPIQVRGSGEPPEYLPQ